MGFLSSTLKFGIKGYITFVAIDYTVQQGFWSGSNKSILAFDTLAAKIKEKIPQNVTHKIPNISNIDVNEYLKNKWNVAVESTAEFILDSPEKISNLTFNELKNKTK